MARYSAEQAQEQGRWTHDAFGRVIDFGSGRDSAALTVVAQRILDLRIDPDDDSSARLAVRTRSGNNYRVPAGFAEALGIAVVDGSQRRTSVEPTRMVQGSVHAMLSGIVEYLKTAEEPPEAIIPALYERLEGEVLPARAPVPAQALPPLAEPLSAPEPAREPALAQAA